MSTKSGVDALAGSKRCPECGTPVKAANLAKHYERVHPRAQLKLSKEERASMERSAVRRDRTASHADWRIAGVIIVVVLLAGLGVWTYESRPVSLPVAGKIVVSPTVWDFGNIDQVVVSHSFQVQNVGSTPLRLDGISTSCMCTSADLTYMGQASPRFGQHNNPPWELTMAPGTGGTLTVYYDPAIHPERGHFQRDVYVLSSDPAQRETTITIHVTEV